MRYDVVMAKVQAPRARRRYKKRGWQTTCFLPPDDESIRAPVRNSRSHRVRDEDPSQYNILQRSSREWETSFKNPAGEIASQVGLYIYLASLFSCGIFVLVGNCLFFDMKHFLIPAYSDSFEKVQGLLTYSDKVRIL